MPAEAAEGDRELIRRAAAGDREAFERIVERHQAAVHRYIRSIVHQAAAAEDALQETFLAAWRAAGTFRGEGGARPWLLAIARHASARQFRRRAGEPADTTPLEDLGREAGWGGEADPEAQALRRERLEILSAALAALAPDDREVIVLRDLEGLTGEEAASVLGLELPALKSRLHRARLRFAARLRREGARDEG